MGGGEQQGYVRASSATHLAYLQRMTLHKYVNMFGRCIDLKHGTDAHDVLAALRHAVSNYSLASCNDLPTDACLRDKAILRIACPQCCGCAQPLTGAYLVDGRSFKACLEA